MYIAIQKNISCEPCKYCGARPVVEQMPKSKFRILCPSCTSKNATAPGLFNIEKWNFMNLKVQPGVLRKAG